MLPTIPEPNLRACLADLLTRWPSCDQELLRGMLAGFDAKWSSSGIALLPVYDQNATGYE